MASPNFASKSSILSTRSHLKTKVLYVADWDQYVILMEMTGKARDQYEAELMQVNGTGRKQQIKPDFRNSRAKLVAKHIVDPSDFDVQEVPIQVPVALPSMNTIQIQYEYQATLKEGHEPHLLFNSIDVNDLGDIGADTLQFIYDACRDLSGISEKDAEELEGELKNGQNADYGSN